MSLFKPSPTDEEIEATVARQVAAQIDARVSALVAERVALIGVEPLAA